MDKIKPQHIYTTNSTHTGNGQSWKPTAWND